MNRPLIVGLAAMLLTAAARPQDSDPEDAPEGGPEAKFQAIDRNGDGALSRDEFLAPARDKDYFDDVKRNFAIYDADEDGSLAPDEFEQTPAVRGQRGPGRVADPIAELAAAAADRFDGWLAESDANGDGRLDETEFSDLERGSTGVDRWGAAFGDWDRGGAGSVSAEEARLAAQIAFGVRNADGVPVRDDWGRLVHNLVFRKRDRNGDGRIELKEFLSFAPSRDEEKAGRAFAAADADGDGLLTSGEFVQTPVGLFSTPRAFKSIDRNADGRLDAAELVARGPGWSKTLAERSAEAFDADGDGVLSFREYRSTPAANPIGDSLQRLTDQNGDGRLSFREFAGGWKGGPPGLTAFFFGQFDRDGDGGLTASEFPFRERTPRDPPEKEEEVVKDYGEEFASRDENGDGSLDREEFLSDARGKKFFPDAQRNFTVYDLDGDGSLQLEEYLQTPATRGDEGPGRVADPISRLVDRAVSRFEGWLAEHDGNGDGGLDLTEFRAVEPADDGGRWGAAFADWSRNRTKLVTTEDARLAAEIAYGVRGPDGSPRRSEQGRVADEGAFRLRDEDGDGSLTAAEYSTYSKNKESAARRFAEADADGSGRLTFEEFRRAPGGSYDTVREYKRADEDEDGLLDASELADDVPRPEQELARKSVVAFDGDGDGQLNFSEFRLTPVANPTGPQLHRLREFDDGGGLDRREFRDEWEGGPPALADLYFDRFDADADGVLSVKEAPFRVKLSGVPPGAAFAARDADGDGRMSLRELHAAAAGVTAADDLAELDQRKLMRSEEALRAADEDRDGLLSLDEFEALSETEAERKANPVGKARPPNPAAVQAALAEDESWFGLGGWTLAFIVFDVLLIAAAAWWWLRRRKTKSAAGGSAK